MRILKFAHVDYLKTKQLNYLLLVFPVLAAVMTVASADSTALFGVAYCLFAGIVLSAFPYNLATEAERGFLQMLPARPGESILGHYLFGFFMILTAFLTGIAAMLISHLIRPGLGILRPDGVDISGLYLVLLGIALLFTGLQNLLMTVLRLENVHVAQLIRIVPAFVFFFGFQGQMNKVEGMTGFGAGLGLAALGVCLAVYVFLALVSRTIAVRRGE